MLRASGAIRFVQGPSSGNGVQGPSSGNGVQGPSSGNGVQGPSSGNGMQRIAVGAVAETIRRSQLFDADWYLRKYPDVTAAQLDPLTHYIEFGAREGRDPNPLFDTDWYLSYYPDVAAAGANPLAHYEEYGSRLHEGRDPHPSFSTLYYFAQNPDVAAAGLNPLLHYLREGRAAGRLPFDPNARYVKHVIKERQQFALQSSEILRHIDAMLYRPIFHVFVMGAKGAAYTRTLESLTVQIYEAWSTSDFRWDAGTGARFEPDEHTFVIFLRAGDTLGLSALYDLASTINAYPSADIVYGDEDTLDAHGTRRAPFYKPDWSPDTLESQNYLGPAACFRGQLAAKVLAQSQCYYDFALRATELTSRVEHLRAIICHRALGAADPVSAADAAADIAALTGRLQRTARTGAVAQVAAGLACYGAKIALTSAPLVSIVIPTAGTIAEVNGVPTDLLFNCLDKIQERSSYKNLEFVIVDNGDLGEGRVERLRQRGCRLITFSARIFNVAKKLNLGASIATGEMLLLLNDDIEPVLPDWIERLLEQFEKPHVGVVGAKLLYPDLTVQHAGVVTNLGNPEHVRKMRSRDDLGYFFSACSVRNFAAVTGACMMTRADLYRRLGGYNEALAISYNDVDYCFKVREVGLTAVYAPGAELIHFESQSRIPRLECGEGEYFHRHWARMLISDPFYNEDNLEVLPASFEVKHNPRAL
nr:MULTISPECIES: glycosyltransferase [unclassified Bradyrhizobium]